MCGLGCRTVKEPQGSKRSDKLNSTCGRGCTFQTLHSTSAPARDCVYTGNQLHDGNAASNSNCGTIVQGNNHSLVSIRIHLRCMHCIVVHVCRKCYGLNCQARDSCLWVRLRWLKFHVKSATYMLFAGQEVHTGKNCALSLEYGPRPVALGCTQDLNTLSESAH